MAALRPAAAAAAPARCLLTQPCSSSARAFSTTTPLSRQTPTHLRVPVERVPDYPYGAFRWYKQRNSGLYGTSKIRFGNTVSEPHMIKQPTQWRPNRHTKRLWSPSLDMFIRTRLTAHVLKTIDRLGGIDEYLLGTKQRRVKELGPAGWRLRWKVMQSAPVQEKWAREREALGLPPKGLAAQETEAAPSPEDIAELDAMLERGDEFVIGEEVAGENFMAEEPVAAVEDAREAAQEVLGEIKSEGHVKPRGL